MPGNCCIDLCALDNLGAHHPWWQCTQSYFCYHLTTITAMCWYFTAWRSHGSFRKRSTWAPGGAACHECGLEESLSSSHMLCLHYFSSQAGAIGSVLMMSSFLGRTLSLIKIDPGEPASPVLLQCPGVPNLRGTQLRFKLGPCYRCWSISTLKNMI